MVFGCRGCIGIMSSMGGKSNDDNLLCFVISTGSEHISNYVLGGVEKSIALFDKIYPLLISP